MNLETEIELNEFREIQNQYFDKDGKSYTGTIFSLNTAEMMLRLINLMNNELASSEQNIIGELIKEHIKTQDMETKKELQSRIKELEDGISYALDSIKIIEYKKFDALTISTQLAHAKWKLTESLKRCNEQE